MTRGNESHKTRHIRGILMPSPKRPRPERRRTHHRLGALCLASVLLPSAAFAQDADLLLEHGKIVTVDERFSIVEAVAIRRERLVAAGGDAELEREHKGPATWIVDLHGRTVIPGLIDGHIHFLRGAEF